MKKIKAYGRKTERRYFFIEALGCPKNLVEAEVVAGSMISAGYGISFDPDQADVYIICTCGFLPSARGTDMRALKIRSKMKTRQRRTVFSL